MEMVSLMKSVITQLRNGSSLARISFPAAFCLPMSLIQIVATRGMRGASLLEGIKEQDDPLIRMISALRWYLASFVEDEVGRKPLNPVLGETFQCTCDGVWCIMEQVSHHPPVCAYYFVDQERDISFWGQAEIEPHLHANSVTVDIKGTGNLALGRKDHVSHREQEKKKKLKKQMANGIGKGPQEEQRCGTSDNHKKVKEKGKEKERNNKGNKRNNRKADLNDVGEPELETHSFVPQMPTQVVRGLLLGKKRTDRRGQVTVACNTTGYTAVLEFKGQGAVGANLVKGNIYDKEKNLVASIRGSWSGVVHLDVAETLRERVTASGYLKDAEVLLDARTIREPAIYVLVDERQCGRDSDTVWRRFDEALKKGDFATADIEKRKVEQVQRELVAALDEKGEQYQPHFFVRHDDTGLWQIAPAMIGPAKHHERRAFGHGEESQVGSGL